METGFLENIVDMFKQDKSYYAHLLGIIGHKDALPFLSAVSDEESDLVRETIEESIEAIKGNEGDG